MFAESETELRDLIVQNLDSCGFLNKIKAELRAGVFLALSEEGNLRKKIPVFHKKLDDFIQTTEGKIAISVIREFLECYSLGFTLSVFDPEIASTTPCISRVELCEKLNINESDCDGSVLSALLKQKSNSKLLDLHSEKNKHLDTISKDFIRKDKDIKGESINNSILHFLSETHSADLKVESETEKRTEEVPKSNESIGIIPQSLNENKTDKDIFSASQSAKKSTIDKDVFQYSKQEQKDIFKDQSSALDPFFDEPVPSEKSSFLNLSGGLGDLNKFSDKSGLSSLKDLPSLTKQTNIFGQSSLDIDDLNSTKKENILKKDLEPESNEDLSDKQLNSEESIEEEIEEDYSALDELLNSSLSLGEDATSDQTVSQTSVVEGVDHIESCQS